MHDLLLSLIRPLWVNYWVKKLKFLKVDKPRQNEIFEIGNTIFLINITITILKLKFYSKVM